jgi:hypothetical protein
MVDPGSTAPSRRWAWLAVAGIVLYVAVDVGLALLRPDVSLLHDPESDYGNGAWSWLMDLNFLIRAGLSIAAMLAIAPLLGMASRGRVTQASPMSASSAMEDAPGGVAAQLGIGLLVVWAAASGLLAFFPDDLRGAVITAHGRVHLLAALVAFAGAAVGTLLLSRVLSRVAGWAAASRLLLGISIAGLVAALLFASTGLREHALGGLWERLFLGLELAWLFIVSVRIARSEPSPSVAARQGGRGR